MNNLGKIVLAAAGTLLLASVAYAGIGIKRLMSVCYNIVKYDFRFDLQNIYLNIVLQVKNPSHLNVIIHGYDLDVFLNKKQVAKVSSRESRPIPGGGDVMINIPCKIQLQKTFGAVGATNVINAFSRKEFDKIVVSLDGVFKGEILKIKKDVPVDYKINLAEIIKIMDAPASAPC